jgi:hypothetical protein
MWHLQLKNSKKKPIANMQIPCNDSCPLLFIIINNIIIILYVLINVHVIQGRTIFPNLWYMILKMKGKP